MSIYHIIVNHSKQQYIDPGDRKLEEFWDSDITKALLLLLITSTDELIGSWCGDRIALVPSETGEWQDILEGDHYENITDAIMEKVRERMAGLNVVHASTPQESPSGLDHYTPLPGQQVIHECKHRYKIVRHGRQAGASLCAAVEIARKAREPGLRLAVVGPNHHHLGAVIHLLFTPVIKDAPPLIRTEAVSQWQWLHKRDRVPKFVTLRNGTRIDFVSAESYWLSILTAAPFDLIWNDEADIPMHLISSPWIWTANNEAILFEPNVKQAVEHLGTELGGFRLSTLDNTHLPTEHRERLQKFYEERAKAEKENASP